MSKLKTEEDFQSRAISIGIAVPLVLVSAVGLIGGWLIARAGGSYRLVKAVLFPMIFTIANLLTGLIALPIVFMMGGSLNTLGDITLWNALFGPLFIGFWNLFMPASLASHASWTPNAGGVAPFLIVGYQVIVYFLFTRWMMRNIALAIYDAANVRRAENAGVDINDFRIEQAKAQPAYARHALFYEKRGIAPPWSMITVGMMTGSLHRMEHYFGLNQEPVEPPKSNLSAEDQALTNDGFALDDWDSSEMKFTF